MSAIGEAFLLFEQATEEPDPRAARELFREVLAMQRTLGDELELDGRELTIAATLGAIADHSQTLEDWPAMRDAAAEVLVDASAYTMYSIALAHLGDHEGASVALAHAIELGPDQIFPVQALAGQRLAAGDRAGALDAIERAMVNGADPEALREDAELSALHGDPRWEQLLSREHHVASLIAWLEREHTTLAESAPVEADDFDAWLEDDDTIDAFDTGVYLAEDLLDAAALDDVPSLPTEPDGSELIDLSACDATQVRAIEALVAAEQFWVALPFLNVLGQHRLPAISPADARERLGL